MAINQRPQLRLVKIFDELRAQDGRLDSYGDITLRVTIPNQPTFRASFLAMSNPSPITRG